MMFSRRCCTGVVHVVVQASENDLTKEGMILIFTLKFQLQLQI